MDGGLRSAVCGLSSVVCGPWSAVRGLRSQNQRRQRVEPEQGSGDERLIGEWLNC
jgi:hypothetical protein